jgi:hypothetical protein
MPRRYGPTEARIHITESGSRLLVRLWAADSDTFGAINDALRSRFPRHGDAVFNPRLSCWSLNARGRRRLEDFMDVTFHWSAVTWLHESAPATPQDTDRPTHDAA